MTGTAATEAEEFMDIYKLDVVEIPTNRAGRPQGRATTRSTAPPREKYDGDRQADQGGARERGQPVLVGTTSIEKSEVLSELLKKRKASRTTC